MKKFINMLIIIALCLFISNIKVFAINAEGDTAKSSKLPTCNINMAGTSAVGYGYITAHYGETGLGTGGPEVLGDEWFTNLSWSEKREGKINIQSSRKLESWSLTFYHDKDSKHTEPYAMCKISNKDIPDNTKKGAKGVSLNYSFTNGHILKIKVDVTDTKNSTSRTLGIAKKLGDTQSVKNSGENVKATAAKTGTNSITTSQQGGYASRKSGIGTYDYDPSKGNVKCNDIINIIDEYWKYVLFLVPVLLILLLTFDFTKAVVASDADQLKKSANSALKRTIATVVLLMLPFLLSMILGWFGIDLCI